LLRKDGQQFRINVEHNWLRTNHAELLYRSALDGGGIIIQPQWGLQQALVSGELQRLLPEFEVTPSRFDNGLYAVYSKHQRQSPKIKAFVEFLAAHWQLPE